MNRYYILWKSSATRDWSSEGPTSKEEVIDLSNDLRSSSTEILVLFMHVDSTISVLSEEDLFEED